MFKDQVFANALVQEKAVTAKTLEEDTLNPAPDEDDESATQNDNGPSVEANEDDTWKKRYSNLRSHTEKQSRAEKQAAEAKEREYQKQISELQNKLKEKSASKLASPDVLARYTEDFPEAMQVFETLAEQKANEQTSRIEAELQWFKEQYKKEQANKTYARIVQAHPDAPALREDPEFVAWFDRQRPKIQDMIQAEDPEDVIEALDKFKKDVGRTKEAAKQTQLEASKAVNTRTTVTPPKGKKVYTEAEISKLSYHEYEKQYDEIMKAYAEGRVTQ